MTKAMAWLCAMLVLVAATAMGCSSRGTVRADAIDDSVSVVCERHDRYVRADATLSAEDRADFLRTTELLRKVIDAALGRDAAPAPTPASTGSGAPPGPTPE